MKRVTLPDRSRTQTHCALLLATCSTNLTWMPSSNHWMVCGHKEHVRRG